MRFLRVLIRGTLFTRGGHYLLENFVRGDIILYFFRGDNIHGGAIFTPTTVLYKHTLQIQIGIDLAKLRGSECTYLQRIRHGEKGMA